MSNEIAKKYANKIFNVSKAAEHWHKLHEKGMLNRPEEHMYKKTIEQIIKSKNDATILIQEAIAEATINTQIELGTANNNIEVVNTLLLSAEKQNKKLIKEVKRLKKAVDWMLEIGKAFQYKAPEQIDGYKVVGAMYATANHALGNPEGLKEDV